MYTYLLQDWTTLRVNSELTSFTQSEADWMSFQPYQDIVFWLDARSVILASAEDVLVSYETAPAKDESLFRPMVAAVSAAKAMSEAPIVTKVLLAQNPDVPLARWVRWKLTLRGAPQADWGATIRIHCAANAIGVL
jgi:hypothetical protein